MYVPTYTYAHELGTFHKTLNARDTEVPRADKHHLPGVAVNIK